MKKILAIVLGIIIVLALTLGIYSISTKAPQETVESETTPAVMEDYGSEVPEDITPAA